MDLTMENNFILSNLSFVKYLEAYDILATTHLEASRSTQGVEGVS